MTVNKQLSYDVRDSHGPVLVILLFGMGVELHSVQNLDLMLKKLILKKDN